MNPSTGTFICMDTYQGSVFDPVSLHKYLYANANPVMYCDPTGHYGTLVEAEAGMGILGALGSLLVIAVNTSIRAFFISIYISAPIILLFGEDIRDICEDLISGSKTSADVQKEVKDEVGDKACGDSVAFAKDFTTEKATDAELELSKEKLNKQSKDYYVYFGINNGVPCYVGITNSIPDPQFQNKINSISKYNVLYVTSIPFAVGFLSTNEKYIKYKSQGLVN